MRPKSNIFHNVVLDKVLPSAKTPKIVLLFVYSLKYTMFFYKPIRQIFGASKESKQ